MTSITIPNSVTSIGSYAFELCTGLKAVNISDLSAWCKIDFVGYKSNPLYYANSLKLNGIEVTDLVIPDDITQIKNLAFQYCKSLTSVTIPNSVTSIGSYAFNGCSGLIEINYNAANCISPDSEPAFNDCTNLKTINIGVGVNKIGPSMFYCCDSLKEVNISDLSAWLKIDFGSLFSNPLYYANTLKLNGTEITDLVIPNDITQIKGYAFYNCKCLTSITIHNSVNSIVLSAFEGCSGLKEVNISDLSAWCKIDFRSIPLYFAYTLKLNGTEVTDLVIPNDITQIKQFAFIGCTSLSSVSIPNSVTSIDYCAFEHCTNLTSITIPNSVTNIGSGAFSVCKSLKEVNISDLSAWCKIDFADYDSNPLYYANTLKLNGTEITDLVIPNDITQIKEYAFNKCKCLKSIIFSNSVTSIGYSAFNGCSGLTDVTFSDSVTYIGNAAFSDCSSLTKLTIGNSVTTLGGGAFSLCKSLTEITIPKSLVYISNYTFSGCSNISLITVLNPEPPHCDKYDPFDHYNSLLVVPDESLNSYKSANCWSNFKNIKGIAGIEGVTVDAAEAEEIGRYDIHGHLLSEPTRGINIIKMNDGSTRKEYVK